MVSIFLTVDVIPQAAYADFWRYFDDLAAAQLHHEIDFLLGVLVLQNVMNDAVPHKLKHYHFSPLSFKSSDSSIVEFVQPIDRRNDAAKDYLILEPPLKHLQDNFFGVRFCLVIDWPIDHQVQRKWNANPVLDAKPLHSIQSLRLSDARRLRYEPQKLSLNPRCQNLPL